jgi:hypothetical protein
MEPTTQQTSAPKGKCTICDEPIFSVPRGKPKSYIPKLCNKPECRSAHSKRTRQEAKKRRVISQGAGSAECEEVRPANFGKDHDKTRRNLANESDRIADLYFDADSLFIGRWTKVGRNGKTTLRFESPKTCQAQLANGLNTHPGSVLDNHSFYAQYADADEAKRFHRRFIKEAITADTLDNYSEEERSRFYACTVRSLTEAKWDSLFAQIENGTGVPNSRLNNYVTRRRQISALDKGHAYSNLAFATATNEWTSKLSGRKLMLSYVDLQCQSAVWWPDFSLTITDTEQMLEATCLIELKGFSQLDRYRKTAMNKSEGLSKRRENWQRYRADLLRRFLRYCHAQRIQRFLDEPIFHFTDSAVDLLYANPFPGRVDNKTDLRGSSIEAVIEVFQTHDSAYHSELDERMSRDLPLEYLLIRGAWASIDPILRSPGRYQRPITTIEELDQRFRDFILYTNQGVVPTDHDLFLNSFSEATGLNDSVGESQDWRHYIAEVIAEVDDLTADDLEPPTSTLTFIDFDLWEKFPAAQALRRSQWTQEEQDKEAQKEWENSPEGKRQREKELEAFYLEKNGKFTESIAAIHPKMRFFDRYRIVSRAGKRRFGIVIKSFRDHRGVAGIAELSGNLIWPREDGCKRGEVVHISKEECGSYVVETCEFGRLETNPANCFSIRKDLVLPVSANDVVDFWMPADDLERERMLTAWITKHNQSGAEKLDPSPEDIVVASDIPDDSHLYAIICKHENNRLIGAILWHCKMDVDGNVSGFPQLEHEDTEGNVSRILQLEREETDVSEFKDVEHTHVEIYVTVVRGCFSLIRRSEAIRYLTSDKAERDRLLASWTELNSVSNF